MASEYRSAEDKALDRFADMLIERISEMEDSEWQKPWFTADSMRWPRNLSGREYSGQNALMLMLHCQKEGYKTPVFCTFNRVAGLNYDANKKPLVDENGEKLPLVTIRKGEKSFPVFLTSYTVVDKETKEKIPYEDYKKLTSEEKARYTVYPKTNVFNVFNIDQTNLAEARPEMYAKIVEANKSAREARLGEGGVFLPVDAMVNHDLWVCPIKPTYGDDNYYSIRKDVIVTVLPSQCRDAEAYVGLVGHEAAHSTGAASRFNRFKDGTKFSDPSYSREELVAEMSAALISSRYGMAKNLKRDSIPYLKSWLDHLQEDPKYLKTILTDVKKASGIITYQIDRIQDRLAEMHAAGLEYRAGGSVDLLPASSREQTLTFDPLDPFADLRPQSTAIDPILHPQLAEAPFKHQSESIPEPSLAKSPISR
ncbi:MAG: ssDNA-binding domain-containing protein [Bacteroidales bacterium]|nr:ssDNA-binding domain-containing protein [Bacteroidales bacterium]